MAGKAHVLPSWVPILASPDPLFLAASTTLQEFPKSRLAAKVTFTLGNTAILATTSWPSQNPGAGAPKRFKIEKMPKKTSQFYCDLISSDPKTPVTFALYFVVYCSVLLGTLPLMYFAPLALFRSLWFVVADIVA